MAEIYAEEVKQHVKDFPIINTIEHYYPNELKKAGHYYKMCCPFHKEKTPSFSVNLKSNTYKCFGCGVSGDSFDFVEEVERSKDFVENLKKVAHINGYNPPSQNRSPVADMENLPVIKRIHVYLLNHYKNLMKDKRHGFVWHYLLNTRKFTRNEINEEGFCYAPKERVITEEFIKESGFTEDQWLQSKLLMKNSRGELYDFFSNRWIIPIRDERGDVIAFNGRIILDEETSAAKYKNSSDHIYYKKSSVLLGIHKSKSHIKNKKEVYIVEGDIDTIKTSKLIPYTVGIGGTSFTKQHAKKLADLGVKKVTIMNDGDTAGRKAAFRMIPILMCENILDIRVVPFKDGEDPDYLITKGEQGIKTLKERIKRKRPYGVFLDSYINRMDRTQEERDDLYRQLIYNIDVKGNPSLQNKVMDAIGFTLNIDLKKIVKESLTKMANNPIFKAIMVSDDHPEVLPFIMKWCPPTISISDEAMINQIYSNLYTMLYSSDVKINPEVIKMKYPFLSSVKVDEDIEYDVLIDEIKVFLKKRISILVREAVEETNMMSSYNRVEKTQKILKLSEYYQKI